MGTEKELEAYLKYLETEELAEGTVKIYLREAESLTEYLSGREVTKSIMVEYKNRPTLLSCSATTRNLHIVAANRYLKYVSHADCMVKTLRIQRKQNLEDVLTMEEYRELLRYARESGREKYYMILRTLAMTGIRVSELKYFTVEAIKRPSICVRNKQKTREICLSQKLRGELEKYCRKNGITAGIIFRGNNSGPISRIAVYKMIVKLADMAGIEKGKAHPHSLRHLFAVTYMEHYGNLFELADLLGHSSLETTRIYTRNTVQKRGQRIDNLGL